MAEHDENKGHGGEGHGDGHSTGGAHGRHPGGHGGGHEEHEGAPEWLISFADNVVLMMGFFVILLAMNMKEPTTGGIGGKEKNPAPADSNPRMLDAVIALRKEFNNPVNVNSTNPRDAILVRHLRQRQKEGESKTTGPEGTKQNVQAQRNAEMEVPCAVIPFDDGSAELSADSRRTLAEAASQLVGQRFVVDVRGHVSAAEAAMTQDQGMDLSFRRAVAVARVLEENGLKRRQLRIVAAGDSWRLTPRAIDRAGHRSNQRVEIHQTSDLMPEDPYSPGAGSGG
jgi:flagellar motor protein MotB